MQKQIKKLLTVVVIQTLTFVASADSSKGSSTANNIAEEAVVPKAAVGTQKLKKKESLWESVNIIKKIETFVKSKNKQNEEVIVDAEKGVFKKTPRALASDPAARKVQENLQKAQTQKLQKYDQVGE